MYTDLLLPLNNPNCSDRDSGWRTGDVVVNVGAQARADHVGVGDNRYWYDGVIDGDGRAPR